MGGGLKSGWRSAKKNKRIVEKKTKTKMGLEEGMSSFFSIDLLWISYCVACYQMSRVVSVN